MTITAVIPTYNCFSQLSRCLQSIEWADEIITVDMNSSDRTRDLAKSFGAKIFIKIPRDNNFDLNRKFGMKIAKRDWVLKLDSDETLSFALQEEIYKFLQTKDDPQFNGYNFYNRLFWFGKQIRHGIAKPESHELRLVRNGKWHYDPYRYHQLVTVEGKVGFFKNYYDHYNYESVSEFFEKTNKYTNLDAKIIASTRHVNLLRITLFPLGSFFKLFFFQKGFLDGEIGLISCFLFSMYNLIEKIKIWENQKLALSPRANN